jgi:hypothetical protein
MITGLIAGPLYLSTSKLLVRLRIDDAVDAIPVHLANGIWGTLSVGLFASSHRLTLAFGETNDTGIFMGGNGTLLACQLVGILFVIGWVAFIMFPFFYFLNYLGWLRSPPADEVEGLDSVYHKPKRRPSSEEVEAMSVYGRGNERLRQNINIYDENQRTQRRIDYELRFTGDSSAGGPATDDRIRRAASSDAFEDNGSARLQQNSAGQDVTSPASL